MRNPADSRLGCSIVAGLIGFMLVIGLIFSAWGSLKAFSRHQRVEDANTTAQVARIHAANQKEVNRLTIEAQEQRVKITEQDADIKRAQAHGLRDSQDIIAQTLTPLYVQHEMVETLSEIAKSGKNATVIYVPIGPDGLPTVANVNPATAAIKAVK